MLENTVVFFPLVLRSRDKRSVSFRPVSGHCRDCHRISHFLIREERDYNEEKTRSKILLLHY